jgi:FixJ family two-component response regulator
MTEAEQIYVVDDDEAVLLSVKAILSQHGYRVNCYSSAEDFLSAIPTDLPGCVITDVQMPGMDGVELQQRLKTSHGLFSLVVVTGVADVPLAVTMMQRGAVTLLEKPYDHIDLLDAVAKGVAASRIRAKLLRNEETVRRRLATLSGEEHQVMEYMLEDKPNKAIAHSLDLSMRTVDRRRRVVLDKMKVKSTPELALLMGTAGLNKSELHPSRR